MWQFVCSNILPYLGIVRCCKSYGESVHALCEQPQQKYHFCGGVFLANPAFSLVHFHHTTSAFFIKFIIPIGAKIKNIFQF
jgi:hypothetical protein